MDLYAKGQLSYLILNCLLERDFYGLDFISEINQRSNGFINLKKPSVYSNLTRMEKQGYVSSYLKSSDLGPNRKYYSITEKGRQFYQDLKEYFDRNNIDVFREFKDDSNSIQNINIKYEQDENNLFSNSQISIISDSNRLNNENVSSQRMENFDNNLKEMNVNPENEDEEDYFDFSDIDNKKTNNTPTSNNLENSNSEIEDIKVETLNSLIEESNDNEEVDKNTINSDLNINFSQENSKNENEINSINEIFKNNSISQIIEENNFNQKSLNINQINNPVLQETNKTQENNIILSNELKEDSSKIKDDAVFLSNKDIENYNKRLYDISKDINKYKRKRSFAEDQISMTATDPLYKSNEKTKNNIEEFKNSILHNKNNNQFENYNQIIERKNTDNSIRYNSLNNIFNIEKNNNDLVQDKPDDGKFITNRVDISQLEKAKKIEPPKLKIAQQSPINTNQMPAPKRDKSIDPSHKDILTKLYSKSKTAQDEQIREDALYDYNDLKSFYNNQNISFNIYKKPAEKNEHNTNKLMLCLSCAIFVLAVTCSVIFYIISLKNNLLNINTNFMFILLPSLFIVDVIIKFYNFYRYKSWLPSKMMPQWQLWLLTIGICGIIIGLNFIFGLSPTSFSRYSTTLILPIILSLIILPVRYYTKRYMLIKYWK